MRPFSYQPNPPKRSLRYRPLDKYEQTYWQPPCAHRPDNPIADCHNRPDLHEQVLLTQLGPQPYYGFNPIAHDHTKNRAPPGTLLYDGPNAYSLEQDEQGQAAQEQAERPVSRDSDGDVEFEDRPEPRHVHFTPTQASWQAPRPMEMDNVPLKSALKQHMTKYDDLKPTDVLNEQFVFDTSEFIDDFEQQATPPGIRPIQDVIEDVNNDTAGHTPGRLSRHSARRPLLRSSPPHLSAFLHSTKRPSPHSPSLLSEPLSKLPPPGTAYTIGGQYFPNDYPWATQRRNQQYAGISKTYGSPAKNTRSAQKISDQARVDSPQKKGPLSPSPWDDAKSGPFCIPTRRPRNRRRPASSTFKIPPNHSASELLSESTKKDSFFAQKSVTAEQHTAPTQQIVEVSKQASPSEDLASPQEHVPSAEQHLSSPSLKRASPSEEDASSIPQQHVGTTRKIITPSPRLARPSATHLFPNLSIDPQVRYPDTVPAPEDISVRRIGGIAWGLAAHVGDFLTNVCHKLYTRLFGVLTKEEIIAVATDMSDSKRRAISGTKNAEQTMKTPSPQLGDIVPNMPGQFSDDSDSSVQTDIPRRGNDADKQSAQTTEAKTSTEKNATSNVEPFQEDKAQCNLTPPESRPASKQEELPNGAIDARTHLRLMDWSRRTGQPYLHLAYPTLVIGHGIPTPSSLTEEALNEFDRQHPTVRNPHTSREQENKRKDSDVDNLIARLEDVLRHEKEDDRLYLRYKLRQAKGQKAKEQKEREEAIAKQAKIEKEREAEELRQQIGKEQEELRQQIKKEQEELRQKAEQEAAEKAARDALRDQLIRPLDPVWDERVMAAMNITNGNHVLAKSPEGIDLTRYVFGKILPQKDANGEFIEKAMTNTNNRQIPGWLDDESINAFFATIVSRKLEQTGYVKGSKNGASFAVYNTGWYKTYKDKGVSGLKTWSRRKGIQGEKLLDAQRVFFPINTGAHWVLLIISPKARQIEFLDSAAGRKTDFVNFARYWLNMELGDKYVADEWSEPESVSNKQLNFDDCGVFTCMNALASAKNKAFSDVTVTKGMMDARRMIVAVLLNGGFHGDWEL